MYKGNGKYIIRYYSTKEGASSGWVHTWRGHNLLHRAMDECRKLSKAHCQVWIVRKGSVEAIFKIMEGEEKILSPLCEAKYDSKGQVIQVHNELTNRHMGTIPLVATVGDEIHDKLIAGEYEDSEIMAWLHSYASDFLANEGVI